AKNGLSAELRLAFLEKRAPVIAAARWREVHASLDQAAKAAPDFWSVVGQTEIKVLEALAQQRLADELPLLTDAFRKLKARVPAARMWDSVYNEAQFTLEPYRVWQKAHPTEVRAADELIKTLKTLKAVPGNPDSAT
ncbi:MAG: hypothetical protein ABUU24_10390, partial [Variovorax sp.]